MKIVIFNESGFPVGEQAPPPPLPENHVLMDETLPLRDEAGRWLQPDGTYVVDLAGEPCFGGADGRTAGHVPAGHRGKGWPDLVGAISDEHPWGLLREPRPETKAEKAAREKAEADAVAAAEAARVAAISVPLFSIRKVFRDTKAQDGQSYLAKVDEARLAGVLSEDAHEAITMLDPVKRSSPYISEFQTAFGFTSEEVDALFIAAAAVPV